MYFAQCLLYLIYLPPFLPFQVLHVSVSINPPTPEDRRIMPKEAEYQAFCDEPELP
jgi:hypothetical protein